MRVGWVYGFGGGVGSFLDFFFPVVVKICDAIGLLGFFSSSASAQLGDEIHILRERRGISKKQLTEAVSSAFSQKKPFSDIWEKNKVGQNCSLQPDHQ